jgi:hypothetical protein
MDAYSEFLNSLIPAKNSLFFEILSLLICVGNCAKSDCGAAVSCYEIGLGSPEIAKFPVKFPISREFAWRRVRSALRRQPTSPARREMSLSLGERPANGGLLRIGHQSPGSDFGHSRSEIADSLRRTFEKLPFLGDCGRRPGSICIAWPSLQCNSPSPPWPPANSESRDRTAAPAAPTSCLCRTAR